MHLLIDTNIFIYREDDRIVSQNVSDLFGLLLEIPVDIFIHPASVSDIQRHTDARRQKIMLSKIAIYKQLPSPPNAAADVKFMQIVGTTSSPQDCVDNEILFAVLRGAADFLLTEDVGIHKKAFLAGINERVLHIDDALEYFKQFLPQKDKIYPPPALKEEFMHNLDLSDPFFDSLKREYPRVGTSPEFTEWFEAKVRSHWKCFVSYQSPGRIGALLIKKIENEAIQGSNPPQPKKKRLKIALLKVTDPGHKIGELLLKLSFDSAVQNDIDELYLTHFTKPDDRLVSLIEEYGFVKTAVNERGEDIFIKKIVPDDPNLIRTNPRQIFRSFYPTFYDGPAVKKWIIPIRPEFHQRLFTDAIRRQTILSEHAGEFIVEGNALKKAYLCRAPTKHLSEGDIVLFYRSVDLSAITSIGIIENVHTGMRDTGEILLRVWKRTVYTRDEIEASPKPLTVILFRHHFHLKNPLKLATLQASGILKRAPQSIMHISDEHYNVIKNLGGIDGRFTVN